MAWSNVFLCDKKWRYSKELVRDQDRHIFTDWLWVVIRKSIKSKNFHHFSAYNQQHALMLWCINGKNLVIPSFSGFKSITPKQRLSAHSSC